MRIAMNTAREARRHYGGDLETAIGATGLELLIRPLAGRLREFYSGDFIIIDERLPVPERREVAAHALGHHLLHGGNQWHHQGRTYSRANYQERQADVFAAFYLMPGEFVREAFDQAEPLAETEDVADTLAATANVTPRFARYRLAMHGARLEAEQ